MTFKSYLIKFHVFILFCYLATVLVKIRNLAVNLSYELRQIIMNTDDVLNKTIALGE
jgi:hypothetical protein